MVQLIVLSGHSGAGKTTRAQELFHMIDGPAVHLSCDHHKFPVGTDTTQFFVHLAEYYAREGTSVIVDGVNLHPDDYVRWRRCGVCSFDQFTWMALNTPLTECILRDSLRPYPVGETAIRAQGQNWPAGA